MKKTIVCILAVMALVLALSGCGDNMVDDALHITPRPDVTSMPEVDDGIVNDDNGVITEEDNGPLETTKPEHSKAPKASATPKP